MQAEAAAKGFTMEEITKKYTMRMENEAL
jgi:hypothetical protein